MGFADSFGAPKHIVRQGQPHMLAYITPSEADLLRDVGGGVAPDGGQYMANGLPAFIEDVGAQAWGGPDLDAAPSGWGLEYGGGSGGGSGSSYSRQERQAVAPPAVAPSFIEQPTFEYSPYGILDTITPEAVQEAAKFQFDSVKNAIGKKANVDPVLSDFIEVPGNFTIDKNTGMVSLTEQGKANMSKDRDDGGLGYWSMSNTADEGNTVAEVAMLGLENAKTGESVLLETTYSPLGVQASHVYANTQAGQRMGMFGTAFGMLAGGVPGAIGTLAGVLEGSPATSGILGFLPGMQSSSDLTGQGLLDYMGWRSPEDKYGFAAPGAFDGAALGGSVDTASAGDFTGAGSYSGAGSGASPGPDLDFTPPGPDPTPPVDDPASPMMYGPTHIYGAFPAQARRRGWYQYAPPTFGPNRSSQ